MSVPPVRPPACDSVGHGPSLPEPGLLPDADDARGSARRDLLDAVARIVPTLQRHADLLDRQGGFPSDDLAALGKLGVLTAPLPPALGGLGLGTRPEGAAALATLLHRLGQGSVALGRVVEGHVNALRLLDRFAAPGQASRAAEGVRGGALLALWVTDPPAGPPLRLQADGAHGLQLRGAKAFCSAAGHADLAVLTVREPAAPQRTAIPGPAGVQAADAIRLLLQPMGLGERVLPLAPPLVGVRGACTGRVEFDAVPVQGCDLFGRDGDYLREPDFSAGAWRACAVAAGAAHALVEQMRAMLAARGRLDDSHQKRRFAQGLLAIRTARLWLDDTAWRAEAAPLLHGGQPLHDTSSLHDTLPLHDAPSGAAILSEAQAAQATTAAVGLLRAATEAACLEAVSLSQRSLGVAALLEGTVERMGRDLQAYLRQPALDAALDEAAAHFASQGLPP